MNRCFFVLLLFTIESNAQSLKWHEGAIVLASGKVVIGNISIEPMHDLVLLKKEGNPTVYPAHKIRSLYFYDRDANINRRFIVHHERQAFVRHDLLYEVVLQGAITVVRRQQSRWGHPSDATDFAYYCKQGDQLATLHKFSRKIYPELLNGDDKRLNGFIRENRLFAATDANLIRIIEYYNHLIADDEALAKF